MTVISSRVNGRIRKKPWPLIVRSKGRNRNDGSVMREVNLISRCECRSRA